MIEIKIEKDTISSALQAIQSRLSDMTPVMQEISMIMFGAVEDNFAAEGRPKWKPSRRASGQSGKTLQDTGRLAASIVSKSTSNQAIVGTNVIYAAIHQFGGKTAPRVIKPKNKKALFWPGAKHPVKSVNHPGSDIPARPFLSLTDDDMSDISAAVSKYLTGS